MKETKKYNKIIASSSVTAAMLSILGAFTSVVKVDDKILWMSVAALIAAISSVAYLHALRKNRRLSSELGTIHEITHAFHDAIAVAFQHNDINRVLEIEHKTLDRFCQSVKKIFDNMTGVNCHITIKLLTIENGNQFVSTYASTRSNWSKSKRKELVQNTTDYVESLRIKPERDQSYFYAADLTRKTLYQNSNMDWQNYYKSTLVVPIRRTFREKTIVDDIGFLCVDTLEPDKLNDDDHLKFLTYFSEQLYFFLSTLRGGLVMEENLRKNAEQWH